MQLLLSATCTATAMQPVVLLPEHARHGKLAQSLDWSASGSNGKELWLTVPLDWSHPILSPKFQLRYYVDESHFDASDPHAPIFVGMGGEGGARGASCTSYRTEAVAKHRALCVGVEHRFYGKSVPKDGGVSTANYKRGLSVEANLHDTAAVIKAVRAAYPSGSGATERPVMNFGGSYSGATCAWFRQRYPDSTAGCVSSSGVVNAIADFTHFDLHVATALGAPCASALRAAQAAVDKAFDAGAAAKVKTQFNATNLIGTPMGDTDFMYAIADGPAMLDQYGHKKTLCEGLAQLPPSATDEDRITNLARIVSEQYGPRFASDCFYDTECVANATAGGGGSSMLGAANARSWRWQKCSELAYLQSAPPSRGSSHSLRSPRLTMDTLLAQCDRAFGAGTSKRMLRTNEQFNALYGGADPTKATLPVAAASNILYLDFSDDPWAEASVQSTLDPTLPFCMTTCDGCGHCGAGVPRNLTHCDAAADSFVAHVLANWRAQHAH